MVIKYTTENQLYMTKQEQRRVFITCIPTRRVFET
jgi:hypothetical protein